MSRTRNRVKANNYPRGQKRNFVSYFQSVTTVGIVTKASNIQEAHQKASQQIIQSKLPCDIIDRTPLEWSGTEEWESKEVLPLDLSDEQGAFLFGFNEQLKLRIASKIGKSVEALTKMDFSTFVQNAINNSLNGFAHRA